MPACFVTKHSKFWPSLLPIRIHWGLVDFQEKQTICDVFSLFILWETRKLSGFFLNQVLLATSPIVEPFSSSRVCSLVIIEIKGYQTLLLLWYINCNFCRDLNVRFEWLVECHCGRFEALVEKKDELLFLVHVTRENREKVFEEEH